MLKFLAEIKNKLTASLPDTPYVLQASYYPALDGVRGVAILVVLLVHIGINHYLRPLHLFLDSGFGVHLFFVLSGFLITTRLLKETVKNGRPSLRRFYFRRALRILPASCFFLGVVAMLNWYYQLNMPVVDFLESLFFLNNLPLKNGTFVTAHFWTLAVEEQFYLTFPLLSYFGINTYFFVASVFVIFVPLISVMGTIGILDIHYLPVQVIRYIFWKGPVMILAGALFAILLIKDMIPRFMLPKCGLLGLLLFILALAIHSRYFVGYIPFLCEYLSALLLAWMLVILVHDRDWLSRIFKSKFFIYTGILSYSVYLWQQPFIGSRAWEPWLHPLRGLPLPVLIVIKLVLITAIACASYYFVERPFLKIKKNFR